MDVNQPVAEEHSEGSSRVSDELGQSKAGLVKKAAEDMVYMIAGLKRMPGPLKFVAFLVFMSYFAGATVFAVTFAGLFGSDSDWRIRTPAVMFAIFGLISSVVMMEVAKRTAADQRNEQRYQAAEVLSRKNPAETRYAWELARIKLESYLDRNLAQVTSIFRLTALVMGCGIGLIGYGVWRAMQRPEVIAPSILAALAGVVIQIIGGTLLVVYRSTMAQAKEYVVVLERINAVGMSINILEGISDVDAAARNAARAQLSRDLLGMYRVPTSSSSRTKKGGG
jgi:hypothetical protein